MYTSILWMWLFWAKLYNHQCGLSGLSRFLVRAFDFRAEGHGFHVGS